ncbi:amphi-Trp domain-containing protein [Actinomycetospora cinnamomea]|uniref:Amphi-Trp domain-containing protein n=1 Tax=Actinomycetospora cinnamomea TaxID=663609 RepID=A0A2U1FQC3_9PSEU|nr:amphi-Trp domain-containing protein [Actinomycetospora cinnamomea]PVZ14393.1 amphi-Trp domain-containing protein [Actinomycetospora cinnamomea]
MSRGEIEQKARLSRQEAARWLGELARAIGEGETVEVALSGAPVTLHLADELECELELEPYGDEVELEIELRWRAPRTARSTEPDRPFARAARP